MGVTGLWRLLEPAGKPVPLETLENKVLAVDISIWLHQTVKGFKDPREGAIVNAHLLGLFQRLCKLLYYRIKPVFVFDGGIPTLKRLTIIKRQNQKNQMHNTVDRMRQQLLSIVTKQLAVSKVISEKCKSPKKRSPVKTVVAGPDDDLFKLPPMVQEADSSESEDESDSEELPPNSHSHIDLHSLDVNSDSFKKLTPREKHDLLTELKETRKQSSWGRIHELPVESDNFSDYQMKRLLKRRQVQVSLEETEKEMGGHILSLNELEILMNEEGIDTKIENIPSRRIASNEASHFVLIKDVKEAFETAAKREKENEEASEPSKSDVARPLELGDEFENDLEAAIRLSLQCANENKPTCSSTVETNVIDLSFLGPDFVQSDSEWSTDEESENESKTMANTDLAIAKAYMLENSGLSEYEIKRIIKARLGVKSQSKSKKTNKHAKNIDRRTDEKLYPDKVINIDEEDSKDDGATDNSVENSEKTTKLKKVELDLRNFLNDKNRPDISENAKHYSLSSDTDDSFEEVPEIVAPSIELEFKTQSTIENDIFSDVFATDNLKTNPDESSNQTHKSSIKKDCQKSVDVPKKDHFLQSNTISEIPKEIGVLSQEEKVNSHFEGSEESNSNSTENDSLKFNIFPENSHGINISGEVTKDVSVLFDSLESNKNNILPNKSPVSKESSPIAECETSLPSSETSPQKGMTLNEIRHMISQRNTEEPTVENESLEKKMISTEELSMFADDLEAERDIIEKQQNKLDRMGRNISDEMTKDAQELLQMFGIPYIVAPQEAEAQCAFLESIKLTDGTITDDSDIWLFGGKSVYKNFFNQQKYVLQFLSENIHSCFKLSREQLILLALLVGSDYTTGVNGVGPVTAMEILAAFPPSSTEPNPPYLTLLEGLRKFRSWLGNNRALGHIGLRKKLKNTSLGQEFPNHKVVEAYLSPEVDKSNEAFSWGKPDITALREFTKQKFGWSQNKTDETLNPVLKCLETKKCQQSIRGFFRTEISRTSVEENMSKRVKMAVDRIGGENVEIEGPPKPKKSRKTKDSCKPETARKLKSAEKKDNIKTVNCDDTSNTLLFEEKESNMNPEGMKNCQRPSKPFIPKRYQEVIPQREVDKAAILKTKLKAIELFRTSQNGPGFLKKRKKIIPKPKTDAELSESSSD